MSTESVSNLFATALILAVVATAVGLSVPRLRARVARLAPAGVAALAIGATLGSLYFSEIAEFVPCELCWFQRIAMYPMAVIMPIALVRKDHRVLEYSLALGIVGLVISVYHIQLQLFPDQSSNLCELSSPCTTKWVEAFGFMSIPQMAGLSFLTIATLSFVGRRTIETGSDGSPATDGDRSPPPLL